MQSRSIMSIVRKKYFILFAIIFPYVVFYLLIFLMISNSSNTNNINTNNVIKII